MSQQRSIDINREGKCSCIILVNPLRILKGKRLVFEAMWEGNTVLVKIFTKKKYWLREKKGLGFLSKFELRSPVCLFSGRVGHNTNLEQFSINSKQQLYVLVLEFYKAAQSFRTLWRSATLEMQERTKLFSKLLILLAQHHQVGVIQKDLHLDNFLVVNDGLVSIDGDAIGYKHSLSLKECTRQLGILLAQSFPVFDSLLESLLPVYFAKRELKLSTNIIEEIIANRDIAREIAKSNWINKAYRESTQFNILKTFGYHVCIVRSFVDSEFKSRVMALLQDDERIVTWADKYYEYRATRYTRRVKSGRRWLNENEASIEWQAAQLKIFFGEQKIQYPAALVLNTFGEIHLNGYFVQAKELGNIIQ